MEDTNVYSITNLEGYAESIRDFVAQSFVENYTDNLDNFISLQQVIDIIIGYSLGQDDEGRYLITEEIFNDTCDDVKDWFYEVGLAKLAAQGLLECAWDDKINQMVFWVPNNDERTNDPTETRN